MMNETIRTRRRALGMTQEQMAERLGVSAPAVSKWEQGASYPDVALLPALARLLGVDMNTLMDFTRAPERGEITRMLERVNERAKAEGIDAGLAEAQTLAREYPSCGALLLGLAATLEGRMMMAGMGQTERAPYQAMLRDWYVRAAESDDTEAREAAANLLALRDLADGEIEAAQRMMEKLPPESGTARWPLETALLLAKGEHEQAKTLLQKTLFARAADVQQILLRLVQAETDEGNLEQAQAMAELTERFGQLLCMHPYSGHLALLMPALARQDVEESLAQMRAMLDALRTPWSPGACLPYAHADLPQNGNSAEAMLGGIAKGLRESEGCAFLRDNATFKALLADAGCADDARESR